MTDRGDILLAEDEEMLRRPLLIGLRRAGFRVEEAATGAEVTRALASRTFDVLLADINMPGNANLELLTFILDNKVLVPVVLMTGQPTVETAVDALRHGVVDYIAKPLNVEDLYPRLDEAIKKGRALRALADAKQRAAAFAESVSALELALSVAGANAASASTVTSARAPLSRPPTGSVPPTAGDPLSRLETDELTRLSPREREITALLAGGNAVNEVATALSLSPNTVRNHIKSIFAKLRVHSQLALMSKLAGRTQPIGRS